MSNLHEVGSEITEEWCYDALQQAAITELTEKNFELFMSFSASLGELAAKQAGIDITPLNERGGL